MTGNSICRGGVFLGGRFGSCGVIVFLMGAWVWDDRLTLPGLKTRGFLVRRDAVKVLRYSSIPYSTQSAFQGVKGKRKPWESLPFWEAFGLHVIQRSGVRPSVLCFVFLY